MKTPLISFIVPLYNKEKFISKTIQSIIESCEQENNFYNYEIIVVDDDSTDLSKDKVLACDKDNIRYIHQKNSGPSKARNNGIEHSHGRYIAFVDGDDLILPAYIRYLIYAIHEYPEHMIFTAGYEKSQNPDYKSKADLVFESSKIKVITNFFEEWYKYPFCFTSSVCVNKRFLELNELKFPEGIHSGEDQYLWFSIAELVPYVHLNQKVVLYNKGVPGQLTEELPLKLDYHIEKLNELEQSIADPFISRLIEKEYTYVITNNIILGYYDVALKLVGKRKSLLCRCKLTAKILFSLFFSKLYLKMRNNKNN